MPSVTQLPLAQSHPLEYPPALRALQRQGPMHRVRTATGHDAWLVTGYEEVRRLMDDPRLGRSHPCPAEAARTGNSALFGGPNGNFATEPADHARTRALQRPHFSPRRMRELRPRIERLAEDIIDQMARRTPPVDLYAELALPLPIMVICELLGVPYADRDRFRGWTQAAADTADGARSIKGLTDLYAYGQVLAARKRAEGGTGDDVISQLCANEELTDEEIARMSMSLLFAGHETTVVAIAMGALLLLSTPGQWKALRDDADLIPGAVEETLRTQRLGGFIIPRYAREDMEVCGVPLRAGDLVILDPGAGNYDHAAFPEADRFEVTREASSHLAFGYGPRYCLGAPLARIELEVVFGRLVSKFPEMRLAAPVETLKFNTDTLIAGPGEVPVTW